MKIRTLIVFLLLPICSIAQNIEKGYHGNADLGYCICTSQLDPSIVEISTSHGYQFNPYLFLGGGIAFDFTGDAKYGNVGGRPYNRRSSKVDIPLFVNAKVNFTKTRFIPFADVKVGATVTDGAKMYMNVAVGCRYSLKNNMGISLSLGYLMRKVSAEQLNMIAGNIYNNYSSTFYYNETDREIGGVILKVGFDF